MNLAFLKTVTVSDVTPVIKAKSPGGPRKDRNPEGLAIRLFKDGSVYPSQLAVDTFGLEYAGKDVEHGYGIDVFDSNMFQTLKVGERILWAGLVKKSEPKIDLFAQVGYDEKGVPLGSVLSQGSKSFGIKSLIPMVEEVYGIKFNETGAAIEGATGVDFVDLGFHGQDDINTPFEAATGPISHVPKKVSRGDKKGQVTVTRRENLKVYALIPKQLSV